MSTTLNSTQNSAPNCIQSSWEPLNHSASFRASEKESTFPEVGACNQGLIQKATDSAEISVLGWVTHVIPIPDFLTHCVVETKRKYGNNCLGGLNECLSQKVAEDILVNLVQPRQWHRGRLLFLYIPLLLSGSRKIINHKQEQNRICEATWMLSFERSMVDNWGKGLHDILELIILRQKTIRL